MEFKISALKKQYLKRLEFLEKNNILHITNKNNDALTYTVKLTEDFAERLRTNLIEFIERINITDLPENSKIPYSFLSLAITETYFEFIRKNRVKKMQAKDYEFDLYIINNTILNMSDILEPFDLSL